MKYIFFKFLLTLLFALPLCTPAVWAGDYEDGIFALKNKKYSIAIDKFKKSSDANDSVAQFQLGKLYQEGWDSWVDDGRMHGNPNCPLSNKYYDMSAENGNSDAQYELGMKYEYGICVQKDYFKAAKYYQASALKGNHIAESNLGSLYEEGKGVLQDFSTALNWYQLSANGGFDYAQEYLGKAYLFGKLVAKDEGKALYWLKLAASRDIQPWYKSRLSKFYSEDASIRDLVRAYAWLNLAILDWFHLEANMKSSIKISENLLESTDAVKARDILVKQMTPQQIAEAQKLARECQARNFMNCD